MKIKESRQKKTIDLYKKGFNQVEIAKILGVNQSTVSRHFNNPTRSEVDDFYHNNAYGAFITDKGDRILYNRYYQPLRDKTEWVKNIVNQEWFYNDRTPWKERFYNSLNQVIIYSV